MNRTCKTIQNVVIISALITFCNIIKKIKELIILTVIAVSVVAPNISIANTIASSSGNCATTGVAGVGYRDITPANTPMKDGSGDWSTIAGCAASGDGKGGVTTFGTSSKGIDNHAVALGLNTLSGAQSTSVGTGAEAQNKSGIAVGAASVVTGDHGVAIGSNVKREIKDNSSLNGGNLHAADKRLESAATGGVAIGSNTDGGARVERGADNSVALGANSKASAARAVALGANSLANKENTISVGSVGAERNITNVKPATLSASSTEAVNGSQLYGTNKSVVDSLGGGSSLNGDGTISGPKYNIQGNTVNSVGDALTALDGATNQNTQNIADNKAAITNITEGINNGTVGLVQQNPTSRDITVAKDTDGTLVDFKGTKGERLLTNVKEGKISADSKDAINGSQLYQTNQLVNKNTNDIKNISSDVNNIINSGGAGMILQDKGTKDIYIGQDKDGTKINVAGKGGNRTISGVKAGVSDNDAVNVRQLREIQNANNGAYRRLDKRIDHLDDKLTAGVASAMAMSGIPQAYQPNSNLAGVALGGYGNKSAIAVGVSHISENGHWVTKLQGSANTESDFGATVGVGYQW